MVLHNAHFRSTVVAQLPLRHHNGKVQQSPESSADKSTCRELDLQVMRQSYWLLAPWRKVAVLSINSSMRWRVGPFAASMSEWVGGNVDDDYSSPIDSARWSTGSAT